MDMAVLAVLVTTKLGDCAIDSQSTVIEMIQFSSKALHATDGMELPWGVGDSWQLNRFTESQSCILCPLLQEL